MSRDQLTADALAAGEAAKHNLQWMNNHPDRFEESKRIDMEAYLNKMIAFSKYEMKNARRLGRTSLRTRLKCLVVSIIAHNPSNREGV